MRKTLQLPASFFCVRRSRLNTDVAGVVDRVVDDDCHSSPGVDRFDDVADVGRHNDHAGQVGNWVGSAPVFWVRSARFTTSSH